MAEAVLEKFPEGKVAIGPAIADGFYMILIPESADARRFGRDRTSDRKNYQGQSPFIKEVISAEEAKKIFADQPYKSS